MTKTEFTGKDILDVLFIGDCLKPHAQEVISSMGIDENEKLTESQIVTILRVSRSAEQKARKNFGKFLETL